MDWSKFTRNNLKHNNDLTDAQRERTLAKLRKKGLSTPSKAQVDAAAEEVRSEDRAEFKPGKNPKRIDGA